MVASRPETPELRPLPLTSLLLRLSVIMESSQVSVLPAVAPAVHCGTCGFGTQTTTLGLGPKKK